MSREPDYLMNCKRCHQHISFSLGSNDKMVTTTTLVNGTDKYFYLCNSCNDKLLDWLIVEPTESTNNLGMDDDDEHADYSKVENK